MIMIGLKSPTCIEIGNNCTGSLCV
jgi:hypothetical protein